jgi:hydrogenase maturation protease
VERPALVLGYGNPGRLDDGLGPAFCDLLAAVAPAGVEVRSAVQLNVEEAAEVARVATVVFVDASLPGPGAFALEPVYPGPGRVAFTSHASTPEAVLGLAHALFGATTRGWTLAIRGARFRGFGEELSETAHSNLHAALGHLLSLLSPPEPSSGAVPS